MHATLEEVCEVAIVDCGERGGDGAMSLESSHRAAVEIITIVCSPEAGFFSQCGSLSLLADG